MRGCGSPRSDVNKPRDQYRCVAQQRHSFILLSITIVVLISLNLFWEQKCDFGLKNIGVETAALRASLNPFFKADDHGDPSEEVEPEDYDEPGSKNKNSPSFVGAKDCRNPQNLIEEANCGTKFEEYYNGSKTERANMQVAFYGRMLGESATALQRFSGCPVNSGPGSPGCLQDTGCKMFQVKEGGDLSKAGIVVVDRSDAERLTRFKLWDHEIPRFMPDQTTRRYRVIYLREASHVTQEAQSNVDFVMGIHFWNRLLNPNFLVRPVTYVQRNKQVAKLVSESGRPLFALSVISNCEPTSSRRGEYISELEKILPKSVGSIDHYGSCGKGAKTPPKPLQNMADLAAKYKFYLAFENTILDGYVTEKLMKTLSFGPIPIYMGAPDVFNITTRRSFINVHDFASPKDLADYLLYLTNNQTAYDEYHLWRTLPPEDAFDTNYLQMVSRFVPGKANYMNIFKEYKRVAPSRKVNPTRVANCCTLCNPRMLRDLVAQGPQHLANHRAWSLSKLRSKLFNEASIIV
mmetsp:Transcript_15012/g.29271  ORF Transcript_15012/g.29271 Transcript_15012/m.29271 type:complete len:520 (-) Transcript_15012:182-1741(-)